MACKPISEAPLPECCLLCKGETPVCLEVFEPSEEFAALIGRKRGKSRVMVYGLCRWCRLLECLTDRINKAVWDWYMEPQPRDVSAEVRKAKA